MLQMTVWTNQTRSQGSVSWMLEVVGRLEDLLLQRLQREAVEKVTLLQQQLLLLGSMLLLLGLTHYRGLAAACLQPWPWQEAPAAAPAASAPAAT